MVYTDVLNMLHINKHRLDDELEIQSEMLNRISEEMTRAGAKEIEAKETCEQSEAELFLDLTSKTSANKMTKDQAEATIKTDAFCTKQRKLYYTAKTEHNKWKGLFESWKARGYDLKALGQLHADQYFQLDSVSGTKRNAGQNEHERLRSNMAEQRQSRHRRTVLT